MVKTMGYGTGSRRHQSFGQFLIFALPPPFGLSHLAFTTQIIPKYYSEKTGISIFSPHCFYLFMKSFVLK